MTDIFEGTRQFTAARLKTAVHKNSALSRAGVLERLFTLAFRGLVYPQIWEDPVIDLEALDVRPDDHMVTIASGGCNVLSYLTANPAQITAVDINDAHVALNRLKLAAVQHLPSQRQFSDFFARANLASNIELYDRYIVDHLDASTRRYWGQRGPLGRRRINAFAQGFYKRGLLGRFIGASHALARLHGVEPGSLTRATSLEEQRRIFDESFAPVFESRFLRWLVDQPASLYGLGIPPSQYSALAGDHEQGIVPVLQRRVEKLACGFPIAQNYFAHQAFGRGYDPEGSLPPYLEPRNFEAVRARTGRVEVRHASMTDFLGQSRDGSLDCFILLDAQDWMTTEELTGLWWQINRTARAGARVIFRTAADERLLPGRLPAALLSAWSYDEARCRDLGERDRSSIYGGFHLYVRRADA